MTRVIDVAAGIIVKDRRILAARRKAGLHLEGYWEFPGGKLEPNESAEDCLLRELKEEFNVDAAITSYVGENIHRYGEKTIRLIAYQVEHIAGEFLLTDHDKIEWVTVDQLTDFNWAPADIPLINAFKNALSISNFYHSNANDYFNETVTANMQVNRERFTRLLTKNASVLDLGCGSGRDSKSFIESGYTVTAIDGCKQLSKLAEEYIGQPVITRRFEELDYENEFDGVWACASLLHCPKSDIQNILFKVFKALKADGVLYASFKNGQKETIDDKARFFNNYTKSELVSLFQQMPQASVLECWEEVSELRGSQQPWVNILCKKLIQKYE
ncbi:NUDIX domain-containing protein [Glaciecola sp. XM2]|uniref:NUDIX domain-containing protein n=1 Tax=Glaciecola sp. XM2 TaxID=1914931 RepID=UPI001BDF6F66|nr:NUDIX domain-containing protein [Glaciecola sp. XM2]MBT1451887.1 NUDIX domain-containing protein [Glaciecola sp. XM2]